jgi:hypothetical protein|tara:strand:- start:42 stop:320 length:279 start_codon:yes stop_codon:yes gene_type:complete
MTDYEDRLKVAKKAYVATDGPGEAGVRLLWCLEQVGHAYTNMDVENLRVLYPSLKEPSGYKAKDKAYILGHITQLFIIPTIVFEILVRRKNR